MEDGGAGKLVVVGRCRFLCVPEKGVGPRQRGRKPGQACFRLQTEDEGQSRSAQRGRRETKKAEAAGVEGEGGRVELGGTQHSPAVPW